MAGTEEHEGWAEALAASGDYRVLRRLEPLPLVELPLPAGARFGVVLDVETTGLSFENDHVIELAMAKFAYSRNDEILGLVDTFQGFNDPGVAIDDEISRITGITNKMVKGHELDLDLVREFVGSAAVVVAHNASFDRPFAERLCSEFADKPWACSMSEPPWAEEGLEGRSLAYLAAQSGFFYGGHRAMNDCMAALELLRRPLPLSGRTGLSAMLASTRQPRWRLWAQTPYELREKLKSRSYRWSSGDNGQPRAWYIDLPVEHLDAELAFLHSEVGVGESDLVRMLFTARDRYSVRF
jgi:DNA polymerase-3 subunit epsilon